MMILKKFTKLLIILPLLFSASCVETVIVGSIATGAVALREKSLVDTTHDARIASRMGAKFITHGLKNIGNSIDITVNEGRVLLTGIVRDEKKFKLASDLAWKVPEVREVINEVQFHEGEKLRPRNISQSFVDYLVTLRIETKLAITKNVSSVNYKITTVDQTVYLLGVAKNDAELSRVLNLISKVRGVEKVVNHIILIDDPRRR